MRACMHGFSVHIKLHWGVTGIESHLLIYVWSQLFHYRLFSFFKFFRVCYIENVDTHKNGNWNVFPLFPSISPFHQSHLLKLNKYHKINVSFKLRCSNPFQDPRLYSFPTFEFLFNKRHLTWRVRHEYGIYPYLSWPLYFSSSCASGFTLECHSSIINEFENEENKKKERDGDSY